MEQALVLGFVLGFALTSTLIWMGFLLNGFVRIPKGHVLAVTRSGQQDGRTVVFLRGGRALVIPFFQRGTLYSTRPIPVSYAGLEIARDGVPSFVCALEAEVLPEQDDDGLMRYVQCFGGHGADVVAAAVSRVVGNGARCTLEGLSFEAAHSNPEKMTEALRSRLDDDLKALGLRIETLRVEVRPSPQAARSRDASELSMDGFRAG